MASFATEMWPGGPPPPPPLLYVPLGIGLAVFCYLVCSSQAAEADRKPLLPWRKVDSTTAPPAAVAPPPATPQAPRTGRSPPIRGAWAPPPSPGVRIRRSRGRASRWRRGRRACRASARTARRSTASAPRRSPDFQAEAASARRPRWPGDGSGGGSDGGGGGGGGSPLAGRGRVRFSRAGRPLSGCAAAAPRTRPPAARIQRMNLQRLNR